MTIHSLMNFCGWKRSPETLSLAILIILAIIQKKKVKGAKTQLYSLSAHLVVEG